MNNRIEKIVIAGGGTAGWLTATYLNQLLNQGKQAYHCHITVIESPSIHTIGVGEATVPMLTRTFQFLGIDEADWMSACNATFKLGIKFVNWSGHPDYPEFWHPFGPTLSLNGIHIAHYWLKQKLAGFSESFATSCTKTVTLCESAKSPKTGTEESYQGVVPYAYHLDAGLLANYLQQKTTSAGIHHILDTIQDVILDEKGYISHLKTAHSGDLTADLFIDCTGFQGLLINQALQEPFESFNDILFCDKAVVTSIPYPETIERINPYTTATALNAGWVWHIPLFNRSSYGYVYASSFISPSQAEAELHQFLGYQPDNLTTRHINMRVGHTRNAWVKNCISLGLASGFIEPLESTGILFVELGLAHLKDYFPDKQFAPNIITQYNQIIKQYYQKLRDFIILHYCLTQRQDTPFWRANKHHPAIPPSLQENLDLWRTEFPRQDITLNNYQLDPFYSQTCILAGMGYLPKRSLPIVDYQSSEQIDLFFAKLKEQTETLTNSLPDHYQSLRLQSMFNKLRQAHKDSLKKTSNQQLKNG